MNFPEKERPFHLEFMQRTLAVVQKYDGPHDMTNLLNCLLGLLIVPNERLFDLIPTDPIQTLAKWGIDPKSIEQYGKCECGNQYPQNLRQLVKSLRHAVAHFQIKPVNEDKKCVAFTFSNRTKFRATIRRDEMLTFVKRLAAHLHTRLTD